MSEPATTSADSFSNVPVSVVVSVGTARVSVRELLDLQDGSILALDRRIEEPVEVFVGETLIARGELHEVTDDLGARLAVRITEVLAETASQ